MDASTYKSLSNIIKMNKEASKFSELVKMTTEINKKNDIVNQFAKAQVASKILTNTASLGNNSTIARALNRSLFFQNNYSSYFQNKTFLNNNYYNTLLGIPGDSLWRMPLHYPTSQEEVDNIVLKPLEEYQEVVKPIIKVNQKKIADQIGELRDEINAVFYAKYKENVLITVQDRDITNLYSKSNSRVIFSNRITSFANLATSMNSDILKTIHCDKVKDGSINHLEAYLKKIGKLNLALIRTFRAIQWIRNGYPAHKDKNIIDGLEYFGISYPVNKDYDQAWKTILVGYRDALKDLFEAINHDRQNLN